MIPGHWQCHTAFVKGVALTDPGSALPTSSAFLSHAHSEVPESRPTVRGWMCLSQATFSDHPLSIYLFMHSFLHRIVTEHLKRAGLWARGWRTVMNKIDKQTDVVPSS